MAQAADVRKFVNGKIVAAGAPPASGKTADNKETLPKAQARALEELVASRPFVALSVGNCPQCEELAAALERRGVPGSVFVKWDRASDEYAAQKEALSAHAGPAFSFPQVFAEGAYQGGFQEVLEKVESGAFDDLFEREFGSEPSTIRRRVERQAMVVFSLPNCPQCDALYEDLRARGLPAQDVFVKLDKAKPEYSALKAQLQRLMGKDKFAFPQTFVRGVYQGDFDEVIAKASAGEYAEFFAEAFGIQSEPKQPQAQEPPQDAIAFDEDF